MRVFLFINCLLFAGAAFADVDAWQTCGLVHEGGAAFVPSAGSTSVPMRSSAGSGGKKSMCYDTDGTTDSIVANTASCDNLDIKLFNMTDGAFADLSVIPRSCPSAAASASLCNLIVADLATATNAEALGYATNYVYIDMVTNTNSDDVRVMIRCNGQ